MKNGSCIYKIETEGGFYIGSSVNWKNRKSGHLMHLRKNIHVNTMLQRAFHKYGEDGLVFSIVEYCHPDKLLEREQYYIDTLSPKYNIAKVAGRMTGYKFTDEQKARFRESLLKNSTKEERSERGRKARAAWTEESKAKQKKSLTGRKIPREIVEKTRKHLIGRPCSPETRAKIAMQKGWKQKPEAIEKSRQYMTGRTGELCPNSRIVYCSNGMIFHGAYEAQKWLRENGYPKAHAARVNSVCRGERNKAYNLIWSREDIFRNDSITFELEEGNIK